MTGLAQEAAERADEGPAYELDGRRIPREQFYAMACDPRRNVAVEACAGAGKTWMLVSRIVRALLAGAEPHEILAITFTRKAAGEMRQRLHEWLAQWAQAPDDILQAELAARGLPGAGPDLCAALRGLHARLGAAGRPVQVRTFHSWFAALLGAAPVAVLEAMGLPARYELLTDDAQAVQQVWRRFHAAVAADPGLRDDYAASVARHGRSQTLKALAAALAKRVEFGLADAQGVVAESVQPFSTVYPRFAGLARPEDALTGELFQARWQARARALGGHKNKGPRAAAEAILDALALADPAARLAALRKALFVAEEDRLRVHLAALVPAQEAEAELLPVLAAVQQHDGWLHHGRMVRLARVLIGEYGALKRERGWIDMNDVERAALHLLSDPVLSGWVQERLDARVRHLLVDEFQDTNPLQWHALQSWLEGYAGAGGSALGVFIVGDPKQSIYRFRRAEPRVFRAAQDFIAGPLGGCRLSCEHTRRNPRTVLRAVNAVFEQARDAQEYPGFRVHTTDAAAGGALWALPQIARPPRTPAAAAPPPGWRDSLAVARETPEDRLVSLECRQAAAWIAAQLQAGTPPADVMVLARKRDRLVAMEEELRALRIPAQESEKTDLCEAPEVRDLIALFDVLVSPGHDLALAQALRSPLFGAGDADLAALALRVRTARQETPNAAWLEVLLASRDLPEALERARQALPRWQAWVQRLPPHDALAAILAEGDVLARFAAAAPAARRALVLANLQALPGAALDVQGGRYLSGYAFVRALRNGPVAGPAVAAGDVVRLLTIHGAKGLEAPIVLVLDADGGRTKSESMGVLCEWPGEARAPSRLAFIASESSPPACCADALQAELVARRREELNALYVAMTRTQSQLVLSSVQPGSAAAQSWWQRLHPHCAATGPVAPLQPLDDGAQQEFELPAQPAVTLPAAAAPAASADDSPASRRGQAMHRLLEHAPGDSGGWSAARLRRVAREFGLDAEQIGEAAAMASRILAGAGAWAWDPALIAWAGNEVELCAAGQSLRLDRLVRRADSGEWWVLDYKSAARPEEQAGLAQQMAAYRQAVARAYPGSVVRTAFLTAEGRLVETR